MTTTEPRWLQLRSEWESLDGAARCLWFVEAVESGKIPMCLRVQQACKRFRQWQEWFTWTPADVDWAVRVIEQLQAPEGEYENILVLPWQAFFIAILHGFQTADGQRACRDVLLIVPRKAGKSTITGALVLLDMVEPPGGAKSPQIRLIGVNEKTANHTFEKIKLILRHDKARFGKQGFGRTNKIFAGERSIRCDKNGGRIDSLSLAARSLDGFTLTAYVVDEVSSIQDRNGIETIRSGMGSARNRTGILTSTPGDKFNSALDDEIDPAIRVLDGEEERRRYFPLIFRAEEHEKEDAGNPELWEKVQPSLGWGPDHDYYQDEWDRAQGDEELMHTFYTRFLCAPSIPSGVWINEAMVSKTRDPEGPPARRPEWRWFVGIDLAEKHDHTAICCLGICNDGRAEAHFEIHAAHSYMPHDRAQDRESVLKRQWYKQGFIHLHDQGSIDNQRIAARLDKIVEDIEPIAIYSDVYGSLPEVVHLAQPHVRARIFSRTKSPVMLAAPLAIITSWVENDMIAMDKNPVFMRHLHNTIVTEGKYGGRMIGKATPNSPHRIDAVDALLIAIFAYSNSLGEDDAGKDYAPIELPRHLPGDDDESEAIPVVLGRG